LQQRSPDVDDLPNLTEDRSVLERLSGQQSAVDTRQSNRIETGVAKRGDEQPIHRPTEYHLDQLGDLRRRHAQTVTLLDGQAKPVRPGACRLPASVHNHGRAKLAQATSA